MTFLYFTVKYYISSMLYFFLFNVIIIIINITIFYFTKILQ